MSLVYGDTWKKRGDCAVPAKGVLDDKAGDDDGDEG